MKPPELSGVAVTGALVAALAPRVFRLCDARLARRRLAARPAAPRPAARRLSVERRRNTGTPDSGPRSRAGATLTQMSAQCRAAGRSIATGTPAATAFESLARSLANDSASWAECARVLSGGLPLEEALQCAAPLAHDDEEICLDMIAAATVDRWLTASSMEHVASVLDDLSEARADVGVAAAQATHTVALLTWLPVVVLTAGFALSRSMRAMVGSPAVLVPVAIGTTLNLFGRAIVRRSIGRCTSMIEEPRDGAARIADCLSAALATGMSVSAACARLDVSATTREPDSRRARTAGAVRAGSSLTDALGTLGAHPDTSEIATTLEAIAREGAGGSEAAAQLARHARTLRRTRARAAVARLPVSLAVPVTVVFLPAFVVGAVVPVVAAGSTTLRPLSVATATHG